MEDDPPRPFVGPSLRKTIGYISRDDRSPTTSIMNGNSTDPVFDTGLTLVPSVDPDTRKPSVSVVIPRVFFVAGAGFEPATFGL